MSGNKRFYGADDITVTPVITAGIYVANDNIGGLMTFNVRQFAAGGISAALYVVDVADQAAEIKWHIFNALPAATFTDNAAFPSLSVADLQKLRGIVTLPAANYVDLGAASWAGVKLIGDYVDDLISLRTAAGNIYIAGQVTGTPTYTSVSGLNIGLVGYYD